MNIQDLSSLTIKATIASKNISDLLEPFKEIAKSSQYNCILFDVGLEIDTSKKN